MQNLEEMSDTAPKSGLGSPGTSQGKRPLVWGDPNNSKRSPSKTAGVRTITFGSWKDTKTTPKTCKTPGSFGFVNINGSKHNIAHATPLLGDEEPYSLLLTGYFDVGWSGTHESHSFKSISKRHAQLISQRITNRCTDLQFEEDYTNGTWKHPEISIYFDAGMYGRHRAVGVTAV